MFKGNLLTHDSNIFAKIVPMKKLSFLALTLALSNSLLAQQIENISSLKLKEIMKGNDFIGHQPENPRWSMDGEYILFEWNPDGQPGNSSYSYSIDSKKIEKIKPDFFEKNSDYYGGEQYSMEVYQHGNSLFRYDRKKASSEIILTTSSNISNIHRVPGKTCVFFQLDENLFCYDLESRSIREILQFGKEGSPEKKETSQLEELESEHFQFLRDEQEIADWKKEQNTIWTKEIPKVKHDGTSISNVQMDGSGKYATFRVNYYPSRKNTEVTHHIATDGQAYTKKARAKVSDEDPSHKLGIYDFERDTTYYADFSTIPNIRLKPLYLRKQEKGGNMVYEKDRKIIMHRLIYSPDGKHNVMDIRSYDNKDRWIVEVNLENGSVTVRDKKRDEAWIGGPGISSWNMVSGTLGWIDNQWFYFQSERIGYSHLYMTDIKTGTSQALTVGNWEVHSAELSAKKDRFYITANKNHPGNREFYHLIIKTRELIPILTLDGNHEVSISPDEKQLAVRYSSKTSPWEVYLADNKRGAKLNPLTQSTTEAFRSYEWYAPEVIQFKANDGKNVYARLYTPESTKKNGAAVIFVHGAGYLQNAHNFWSGYYREYMFHNLLRDNGFTVLDIDYRASKGYGRDHRTAIYRHMGGKDLSDHLDGRQLLIDSLGIDANRIGIYGGSYGGFITLMGLLTAPGKFKCGAAIRSVTDWFHYNHEYTSNILNYPGTDPEAYRKSSPIYFADNLQDRLLMLHGMVDDNVQFQDVVRLSQRFIELGKENWEMAIYPVEPHGFRKSYSWTDEYRRIYELFYEELILNAEE